MALLSPIMQFLQELESQPKKDEAKSYFTSDFFFGTQSASVLPKTFPYMYLCENSPAMCRPHMVLQQFASHSLKYNHVLLKKKKKRKKKRKSGDILC